MRRGGAIAGPPGPILVATRNDVLDDIVDRTPQDRRKGGLVVLRLAWRLACLQLYLNSSCCDAIV